MKNKLTVYVMIAALSLGVLSGCERKVPPAEGGQETETQDPDAAGDNEGASAKEAKAGSGTEGADAKADKASDAEEAADSQANADQAQDKPAPEIVVVSKTYYETAEDENYTPLLQGHFQTPVLSEESALIYPELAKAMEADAVTELDFFDSEVESDLAEAKEYYDATYPDSYFGFFTVTQDVSVKRADEKVVSIFFPVTQYMGGAHGIYGNGCTTYDSATGKILELQDVLADTTGLNALIKADLEKQYPDHEDVFFGLEESLSHYVPYTVEEDVSTGNTAEDYENYQVNYTWALNSEGLELYFGPYELAAYASGAQTVVLTYDEHPELFKPEYIPTEKKSSYLEYFEYYLSNHDIDGDGSVDSIYLEPVWNENKQDETDQDYINLELSFNTESLKLSEDYDIAFPDEAKGYYIHLADGRDYVYVIAPTYSDYIELIVVDITGGKLKKVGEEYYPSFYISYDTDNETSRQFILSDPEHMKFATRFDLINTFSGFKDYHVGPDGMPVSDDTEFKIYETGGWEPVTCIRDFEATYINESGEEEPFTVKTGETFTFLSTDGKSYIDTEISDGTRVRLYVEGNGMDVKVNGLKADEIFKELMYAG